MQHPALSAAASGLSSTTQQRGESSSKADGRNWGQVRLQSVAQVASTDNHKRKRAANPSFLSVLCAFRMQGMLRAT
jgi:hypothetical protein